MFLVIGDRCELSHIIFLLFSHWTDGQSDISCSVCGWEMALYFHHIGKAHFQIECTLLGCHNLEMRQEKLYIKSLTNFLIIYHVKESPMLFLLHPCGSFAKKAIYQYGNKLALLHPVTVHCRALWTVSLPDSFPIPANSLLLIPKPLFSTSYEGRVGYSS